MGLRSDSGGETFLLAACLCENSLCWSKQELDMTMSSSIDENLCPFPTSCMCLRDQSSSAMMSSANTETGAWRFLGTTVAHTFLKRPLISLSSRYFLGSLWNLVLYRSPSIRGGSWLLSSKCSAKVVSPYSALSSDSLEPVSVGICFNLAPVWLAVKVN